MDKNDFAALRFKTEFDRSQFLQLPRDGRVFFLRRIKHQEPARARAKQLAADRPGLPRPRIPAVNQVVAHFAGEAAFEQPVFVDDFAERRQVIVLQFRFQLPRQPDHFDHRSLFRLVAGHGVRLRFQNSRGTARDAGVKNQQVIFQLPQGLAPANDRLNGNGIILVKLDEAEPAKRGGVLILLADRLTATPDFNLTTFLRQLVGGGVTVLKRMERVVNNSKE